MIIVQKAPNDKKKIYYALTSNGKVVAKLYDEMHQEIITEIEEKFSDKYSENELKTVIRFLHDLREFEDNFSLIALYIYIKKLIFCKIVTYQK